MWLSRSSAGLQTKRSPVRVPVRAHAWVVGRVPGWGHARGNWSMFLSHIDVSLLLSPSPPLFLKINKILLKCGFSGQRLSFPQGGQHALSQAHGPITCPEVADGGFFHRGSHCHAFPFVLWKDLEKVTAVPHNYFQVNLKEGKRHFQKQEFQRTRKCFGTRRKATKYKNCKESFCKSPGSGVHRPVSEVPDLHQRVLESLTPHHC